MLGLAETQLAYQRTSVSNKEIFEEAMSHYREWSPAENPFTGTYEKRVLVLLLGPIYQQGMRAEQWAQQYLKEHALEECSFAREVILANMAGLDDIFLVDRVPGAINQLTPEYMAKAAYAGVQSFLKCKRVEDWRRPRNPQSASSWTSKVDWDLYTRLNPRAVESGMKLHRELEEAVRGARAHDTAVLQVEQKMVGNAKDLANP